MATSTNGVADVVVVVVMVVVRLKVSSDCFYFLKVIIRVRAGRGY